MAIDERPSDERRSDDKATALADRRPLASRDSGFARRLTSLLLKTSITPNQISLASIAFAAVGAAALVLAPVRGTALGSALFVVAALGIQLRLVCNLLDGLIAVEGGRGGKDGALYNEAPDRVADSLIIVALGYAAGEPWLGWAGALAAALTAYVRVLGGSLGLHQEFTGPMAKQQRMALITGACLLAIVELWIADQRWVLWLAAWVVLAGSCLTIALRLARIRAKLLAG